ncbi:hypothetical protein [Alcanivorax sp.]|uniref:hypothetical protein n=1 Tax=Alcanivorax sp. TaxID=1872427 RepID=UPI000C11B19C|nr:hypothetical protein [Alcanivorax sp.]PHR68509.1 MAG: hypothetical protein COA55_00380 [Alcanivorax sp.]
MTPALHGIWPASAGLNPMLNAARALPGELGVSVLAGEVANSSETLNTQPVAENPRTPPARRLVRFLDDYYFRIHVTPPALDVGNVVSAQTHPVRIWNAYLEPRTLNDLAADNAEGIQLAGPDEPPMEFAPLREHVWEVAVGVDGPPVVDASFTWQFTGEPPAVLPITGNRITAWPWAPNWLASVQERLEWLTDILQSQSGVEQRRAGRDLPRRFYGFSILAEGADRALLDLAVFGWGSRLWALPIWQDVQWLPGVAAGSPEIVCDTRHRDFQDGGLVLLLGERAADYEVLEIHTLEEDRIGLRNPVQREWPHSVRLFPVRTARLTDQPALTRLTNRLVGGEVEFRLETPSTWPQTHVLPEYRGWPVLEIRPEESRDLSLSYQRLINVLDNGTASPNVRDRAGIGFPVQGHGWLLEGAEERANWRSLMYALRGRQGALWLPTWMDDLEVVAPVATTTAFIDVAHVQYGRFAAGFSGRRDIRLELSDGTVRYRRVLGATELDASTERLSLAEPWDVAFDADQVQRVSWMALMRLESDTVEIEHQTDVEGVARSQLVFRGVRDEL